MRFALLVTTLGRRPEMRRLLQSLQRQTCQWLRVYVGDQSRGMLDDLWLEYRDKLSLRVFALESRGVSAARNALMQLCSDDDWDIMAFPDDDCWYAATVLEDVAGCFARNPHADVLLTSWKAGPKADVSPEEAGQVTPLSAFRRAETYVQFYRRHAVERIGQWDERLGPGTGLPYGCGEDTDYVLRAIDLGLQVRRENSIEIYHPGVCLHPPAVGRWRAYGRGRMYLLHKHAFPFWFRLGNVLYPLWRMVREHPRMWRYRWHMFYGRLEEWLFAQILQRN